MISNHNLPQLILDIDVKKVNKSMIEFHKSLDELNNLISVFTKWGIPLTYELLKELKEDYNTTCDKYFSIISKRIQDELSAQPNGLDIENYKKEIKLLESHFNNIKWNMKNGLRGFLSGGLVDKTIHIYNNSLCESLAAMYFYVCYNSNYAETGDESFIVNKLQDICNEMNKLRKYKILPHTLLELIKDSPNEGYVIDTKAFYKYMDEEIYHKKGS